MHTFNLKFANDSLKEQIPAMRCNKNMDKASHIVLHVLYTNSLPRTQSPVI